MRSGAGSPLPSLRLALHSPPFLHSCSLGRALTVSPCVRCCASPWEHRDEECPTPASADQIMSPVDSWAPEMGIQLGQSFWPGELLVREGLPGVTGVRWSGCWGREWQCSEWAAEWSGGHLEHLCPGRTVPSSQEPPCWPSCPKAALALLGREK